MDTINITSFEQLPAGFNFLIQKVISLEAQLKQVLQPTTQTPAPAVDQLLNRREAAAVLRISLPTLNELTKSGKISAFRIPNTNRLRYYTSEVNKCLTVIKPAA